MSRRTVASKPTGPGPWRTCIVCRAIRRPDGLVRIAVVGDRLEPGRSLPGRGAWVCEGPLCLGRLHEKALSRALRTTVTSADREDLQRRLA